MHTIIKKVLVWFGILDVGRCIEIDSAVLLYYVNKVLDIPAQADGDMIFGDASEGNTNLLKNLSEG